MNSQEEIRGRVRDAQARALDVQAGFAANTALWWLSFADPDLPEGHRFLGVAVVEAQDGEAAVARTHLMRINPGGEVLVAGPIPLGCVPVGWWDRFLTRDGGESMSIIRHLLGEGETS